MEPIETIEVACPYCGEQFTTFVDTSNLPQNYTEDCQICCAPIVFDVYIDMENPTLQFNVHRENE